MPTPDNTGKQHIIKRSLGERSSAIHVGEEPDAVTHASAPNLVMSTTFDTGRKPIDSSRLAIRGWEGPILTPLMGIKLK